MLERELGKAAAGNREAVWNLQMSEVRAFATNHDRWPSTSGEADIDATMTQEQNIDAQEQARDEKLLGQWFSRMKFSYKKFLDEGKSTGMTPDRAKIFKSLLDDFAHLERSGKWIDKYNACVLVIETTKKIWPSTDEANKKNLIWFNQQKTFYRKFRKGEKKGGMTADRANLIEELMIALGEQPMAQQPMKTVAPNEPAQSGDLTASVEDN